jgi:K+-sensing histidine kinase KdpD
MRNLDEISLVAFLCHELANPLTSIFGKLSIFELGKKEEFEKKHNISLLSSIKFDANRISRILAEAASSNVDCSIGSGFSGTKINSCDLIKKISTSFLSERVDFFYQKENVNLFIDEFSVVQACVNVIGNAIKCSPEKSRVTVKGFKSEKSLIILVKDSGRGIPGKNWEDVFYPFSRLNKSETPGLGLGLYLSKLFILRNGGSLRVKESGDAGTIFEIELPIV